MRAWLRSLIGWDDIAALADNNATLLGALNRKLDTLDAEIEDLTEEIESLKYMKTQRESKAQARTITDWERIQAEFAANPDNFKEIN